MNSKSRERKPADLKAAAKHVEYEVSMLVYAAQLIRGEHSSPKNDLSDPERNMAADCFLLHFRNLRDFLIPPTLLKADDVLGSDFTSKADPPRAVTSPTISAGLVEHQERLNKMLTHLSYSREKYIRSGDDAWRTVEMVDWIVAGLREFLDPLPVACQDWFPSTRVLADSADWMAIEIQPASTVRQLNRPEGTSSGTALTPSRGL